MCFNCTGIYRLNGTHPFFPRWFSLARMESSFSVLSHTVMILSLYGFVATRHFALAGKLLYPKPREAAVLSGHIFFGATTPALGGRGENVRTMKKVFTLVKGA